MSKIGKIIPKPIKNSILWIVRRPEKISNKIYQAAAKGKIPFPDKAFQKWDYKVHTGRKLNIKTPKTYQEKLQWLKYYYRNPEYTRMVDKYAVREYVKEKIGDEYLVPLFGVYDSFEEIDFDKLPNQFVLKCTHDQGSVCICKDKKTFDYEKTKTILNKALATKHFYLSREWYYKNVKPRILCEKLLEQNSQEDGLIDYKFLCFNGVPKVLYVYSGRNTNNPCVDYRDIEWNRLPIRHGHYNNSLEDIPKPENYKLMIELAEKLSYNIPFVRIDFYESAGRVYFGEMTFFPSGGRILLQPEKYNYVFGQQIGLPVKMRVNK